MKRTLLTLSVLGAAAFGPLAFGSAAQAQTVGQPLPRGMKHDYSYVGVTVDRAGHVSQP